MHFLLPIRHHYFLTSARIKEHDQPTSRQPLSCPRHLPSQFRCQHALTRLTLFTHCHTNLLLWRGSRYRHGEFVTYPFQFRNTHNDHTLQRYTKCHRDEQLIQAIIYRQVKGTIRRQNDNLCRPTYDDTSLKYLQGLRTGRRNTRNYFLCPSSYSTQCPILQA